MKVNKTVIHLIVWGLILTAINVQAAAIRFARPATSRFGAASRSLATPTFRSSLMPSTTRPFTSMRTASQPLPTSPQIPTGYGTQRLLSTLGQRKPVSLEQAAEEATKALQASKYASFPYRLTQKLMETVQVPTIPWPQPSTLSAGTLDGLKMDFLASIEQKIYEEAQKITARLIRSGFGRFSILKEEIRFQEPLKQIIRDETLNYLYMIYNNTPGQYLSKDEFSLLMLKIWHEQEMGGLFLAEDPFASVPLRPLFIDAGEAPMVEPVD